MPHSSVVAYIGLGSNLQSPVEQIESAIVELGALPQSRLLVTSSLYRSAALVEEGDTQAQPDYINAVASIETTLPPHELLRQLQQIEAQHQRRRERRWGPRTLDLDLLLYGDDRIDTADLTVPHPGLCERNFVLIPLFEIAPKLRLPDGRSLLELVECCSQTGLVRLAG